MPYQDVPAFMEQVRAMAPTPARLCLQWLILTACRSGEARHSIWNEIVDGTWIMPAERTKMRRLHVVPLPNAAQAVLEEAKRLPGACPTQALIFPGYIGSPLSDMALTKILRDLGFAEQATVHGFRSSFRTWAAEVAKARPEVAEAALAHAVRDKVEAAYRRAAYLEERRQLMQAWASYTCGRRNFLAITTLSARRRVGL